MPPPALSAWERRVSWPDERGRAAWAGGALRGRARLLGCRRLGRAVRGDAARRALGDAGGRRRVAPRGGLAGARLDAQRWLAAVAAAGPGERAARGRLRARAVGWSGAGRPAARLPR